MGPELASLLVAVITGIVGWWLKRGQAHTAQKTAEGNERLEGKLDTIIQAQEVERRARFWLEYRMARLEKHVGLSPMSPPDGTPAYRDS